MDELYDEVIRDEPNYFKSGKKENKKFDQRLRKSIGWVEPYTVATVPIEEGKGKDKVVGTPYDHTQLWDVNLGDGLHMTCEKQEIAVLLGLVAQINERLKRVENKIGYDR